MKIEHKEPHGPLRQREYPPVGEQLDAIMKLAQSLREQGLELPIEVLAWVDSCIAIKNKYKKNS